MKVFLWLGFSISNG